MVNSLVGLDCCAVDVASVTAAGPVVAVDGGVSGTGVVSTQVGVGLERFSSVGVGSPDAATMPPEIRAMAAATATPAIIEIRRVFLVDIATEPFWRPSTTLPGEGHLGISRYGYKASSPMSRLLLPGRRTHPALLPLLVENGPGSRSRPLRQRSR